MIRSKFKQNRPLWPQEVDENRVIWPYRFKFDVTYCLPREAWENRRLTSEKLIPRAGFQPISEELAVQIIGGFPFAGMKPEKEESAHESIKAKLVEIGRIQKMIAEREYDMDGKLDVVWRRVERGCPRTCSRSK